MKNLIDTMKNDEDFDATYLSLGAGVQSSALLVLSCTDHRVPKPDIAVFADTGDEPDWVYENLDVLKKWAEPHGVPILVAQSHNGKLSEYVIEELKSGSRFNHLPVFTETTHGSSTIGRRQCTSHFKIVPIIKAVRTHLGYKPRQRVKERVRCMLGISLDEMQRMKENVTQGWITNCWPLIDLAIRRKDCYKIIEDAGLPKPKRSSCVYCPFNSDPQWQWLKDEHPREFAKAVEFDERMRVSGLEVKQYLHKSCVPLRDAVFGGDENQVDMFNNECDGICGV
tara:strand:+ start:879 stop:1724 length:846 start_codon:yes stop_codon:yes gene_type:complete